MEAGNSTPENDQPESALPPPNQPEATQAEQEVDTARRDIESKLTDGSLDLTDLFEMSNEEAQTPEGATATHRVVGHMHIRAALLALPHIGDTHANEILESAGIEGNHHIDSLGDNQRQEIVDLAETYE